LLLFPGWDGMEGDRGWETRRKGAGGVREVGEEGEAGFPRWREAGEKGKIMQHCAMFCNPKNAKRQKPKNTGKELGLKGTGSGRFKPPCPLHDGGPMHGDPRPFFVGSHLFTL